MNNQEKDTNKRIIIGGAVGNCVHIAGVYEYLRIAEKFDFKTIFLGAAVSPEEFVKMIEDKKPEIVCISYRLTPSGLRQILNKFFKLIKSRQLLNKVSCYFGGTPECIAVAKEFSYFKYYFQGEESFSKIKESLFIGGKEKNLYEGIHERVAIEGSTTKFSELKDILESGNYLPMLRHHFGLPSLEKTIEGIRKISEAEVVDVISLAPDQNAQEYFFEPDKMDKSLDGTGGVPIRKEEDLGRIWEATQRGNYPRLRIYAGTRNLLKWAKMSVRVINNAWGTIPIFWYSKLDGRSKRTLFEAIRENKEVIEWYGRNDIPVEINDAHQWSLRDCSDVNSVADFYIVAYNAKKIGVRKYIAQFMFNTPRLTSAKMDLAKMLAKKEMLDDLVDDKFVYLKQVRAGLTHFSVDMDIAKGQLSSSTFLSLALKPHIIHVVSFTEANHAATLENVIESCKIVKGVLKNSWKGLPDMTKDPVIVERKNYLVKEAKKVVKLIKEYFSKESSDPLTDNKVLAELVKKGFLDAPHLKGNPEALGKVKTAPINGGYERINEQGKVIKDSDYISKVLCAKNVEED